MIGSPIGLGQKLGYVGCTVHFTELLMKGQVCKQNRTEIQYPPKVKAIHLIACPLIFSSSPSP